MRTCELLLFDGVDLLDVGGPYEVLLTANRLVERSGETPPFEVATVAAEAGSVTAYGGLGLVASHPLTRDRPVDVVLVPGAVDLERAVAGGNLLEVIAERARSAEVVATVCTGSILLARAGALHADVVTTHHEDLEVLRAEAPGADVRRAPWVDTGRLVMAGGLSNGIAMALHLVDRLHGRELAVRTAAQIEYDWDPDAGIDASGTSRR